MRQDYAVVSSPYRAGPWPGLTPRGALWLLICAVLLGVLVERLNASAALAPLVLATWIVRTPGAASAVTGAYLLPRTLWSLLDPSVPLPALLLVPAIAFDLAAWVRATDVRAFRNIGPRRRNRWPAKRDRSARRLTPVRLLLGGSAFAITLAAVEPAWESFVAR
jgi:hypothetical protein